MHERKSIYTVNYLDTIKKLLQTLQEFLPVGCSRYPNIYNIYTHLVYMMDTPCIYIYIYILYIYNIYIQVCPKSHEI